MRLVAAMFALLLLGGALPAAAAPDYDDCDGPTAVPRPCAPVAHDGKTYFLWLGQAACPPDVSASCRVGDSKGGLRLLGIVYEDSNRLTGLQRTDRYVGDQFFPADKMVLV